MSKFIRAYLADMIHPEIDSENKPALPKSLQWMPAGESKIVGFCGGQPWDGTVITSEADAAALDAQLQRILAESAAGKCSRPFIDFDHEGKEAAAIPVRFFWENGIRLEVEWTEAGAEAISGRTYSYFSPEWLDGEDMHPVAIPNRGPIGALVNTPAFQEIERLSAAQSGGSTDNTNKQRKVSTMDKLLAALVEAKLIPSAKLDDNEAATLFKESWGKQCETMTAKDATITALNETIKAANQREAESFVAAAVQAGKINDETTVKAHWVSAYQKDAESVKAMLASIVVAKTPPGAKPAPPAAEDSGKELETVRASLAKETDPTVRATLAAKARELRGDKDMFKN